MASLFIYFLIARSYLYESIVMNSHMQARNWVIVRLQCIWLCVGFIIQIPWLDDALVSRPGKPQHERNEEMTSFSHSVHIPWEISVSVNIKM